MKMKNVVKLIALNLMLVMILGILPCGLGASARRDIATMTMSTNNPSWGHFEVVFVTYDENGSHESRGVSNIIPSFSIMPNYELFLLARPSDSYAFERWEVLSGTVTGSDDWNLNPYVTIMSSGDVSIRAVFERYYTVEVSTDDQRSIYSPRSYPDQPRAGRTVTLCGTPPELCVIKHWEVVSGMDIDRIYPADATIDPPDLGPYIGPPIYEGCWQTFVMPSNDVVLKAVYQEIPTRDYSSWALAEIIKAMDLKLIPDILLKPYSEYTRPITRAEFAAVSVKVYEALSGTTASPSATNPFSDTSDIEILKAYNLGITMGTSASLFSPNDLLSREEAATMLTRVFKRVTMSGWTLAEDSKFTLSYNKTSTFADDNRISDWAKDSVYFMTAKGIIQGTGNNKFSPRAITSEEKAEGSANATREQALAIAVRMVENLK